MLRSHFPAGTSAVKKSLFADSKNFKDLGRMFHYRKPLFNSTQVLLQTAQEKVLSLSTHITIMLLKTTREHR